MVVIFRGSPSPEMALVRQAFLLVSFSLLLGSVVQSAQPTELHATARSDSDDTLHYRCPVYCECSKDLRGERWVTCTVPYFTPDFVDMTQGIHPMTWGVIIRCYTDKLPQDGGMPDSMLWTGVFSHLRELHALLLDNCSLKTLKSSALDGLTSLQILIIRGAHLSHQDSDLITQLPSLRELEISFSSVTKVFPLCNSRTLTTVNLTANHLNSMEDTGLFCPRGSLSQLERVDVHNNFITELPPWLSDNFLNLTQLVVADNYIHASKPKSLTNLPNLSILDLSNNSYTTFHPRYFDGCQNVVILGLSRNKVPIFPRQIFSNVPNILQLEISEMGLDDRLWMELLKLDKLMTLNMSFNEVTSLNADIMAKLTKLEHLEAQNNRIRDIPHNTFEKQENLKTLTLSFNEITRVPKIAFSESYALKELHLDHNNISLMDAAAISGLERLEVLNLSFNKLQYLPINVFAELRNLRILDISSNNIRHSLDHKAFSHTGKLEHINASYNSISEIPVLHNIIHLKTVDVSHNNITTLRGSTFLGLGSLTTVSLKRNQLKSLANKIFKGCDSLRILDLSYNFIENLGDSTFGSTRNIESITLSHNALTDIRRIFRSLNHLTDLDLSYNKLTHILQDQFPNSLERLNLKHNHIHTIRTSPFKLMRNIRLVDISANELETLAKMNVEVTYKMLIKPTFIIRYNPFMCDCNLAWLKDYADGAFEENFPLPDLNIKHGFMCRSPFHNWAQRIQNIDRSLFLCNYTNQCEDSCMCCDFDSCHCKYRCPQSCRCFTGDEHLYMHHVRCNSAQLTSVPEGLPEGATAVWMDGNDIPVVPKHAFLALKHVEKLYLNNSRIHTLKNGSFVGLKAVRQLYLQDNYIKIIQDITFKGLESLEEVFLQNNDIYLIEPSALVAPPFLVRVNIQGNALTVLPTRDLETFVNRSVNAIKRPQLFLSANPWTCERDFSCRFLHFLTTNSEVIQDLAYIECIRPLIVDEAVEKEKDPTGRLVLDLQQDLCAENVTTPVNMTKARLGNLPTETEMYAVIAACIIIPLIILIIIVGYINRHFLQVFCFTRFGFRPFKMANAADDKERPYDAFISYSSKDEDFVIRQLAPRLEKGDKKFKLCVHYRDFPVGACIAETIVRSVEASKRTILVVSDNFLDSEWCRFEFQTAHQQVLTERRNRVILILMHNVDTEKLDNTLKVYMKTRTYLKYDDAWFWEKLMFAMPDIRQRKQPEPVVRQGSARGLDFIVRDNSGRVSVRSQTRGMVVANGYPVNHHGVILPPGQVRMPDTMTNDMYEIPVLDSQSGHYQLANGICCSPTCSPHTNSAFQPNYSDTTSGYHNGSVCCSSSAHYEEVGPGIIYSAHSTPHKHLIDTPPPLPRIPQEGFIPRDKMTFV